MKITDYFLKLIVSSYKESSHEEYKSSYFLTYVPVNLIKPKLKIHSVNPTNPDILKLITEFL